MCQETHNRYSCNSKHTELVRVEKKCAIFWAPHRKVKFIRGYIDGPCKDCTRIFLVRPAQQTYTVIPTTPIVYTPAPTSATVIVNPVAAIVVPTSQPAKMIIPPTPPLPVPTSPQQIPALGSRSVPLDVKGTIVTGGGWEWMKSKNCFEYVVHYRENPAAPVINLKPAKQGFNTIHGRDPGPTPPGWGAQPNSFPAKKGFNMIHGTDHGPPPPGSKSSLPQFLVFFSSVPLRCLII
jgi:hypothetical protein